MSHVQSLVSDRRWRAAGLFFCVTMLCLHVAAAMNSNAANDFWRDFYWATSIAHGERFPLAGPPIYSLIELGPWWFYLLALPVWATGSVVFTMVFVQVLASLKYFLAWRLGLRIADARFALTFAASLTIAGWSIVPLAFPTHTALIETTILLLALVTWRCAKTFSWTNAITLGLCAAACLHAHPSTALYVMGAGIYVLVAHRSKSAFAWMCLSVAIAAASLLPPWLDRSEVVAGAMKSVSGYVNQDVGVNPSLRIWEVAKSLTTGGLGWSLGMLTRWSDASVHIVRVVYAIGLVFAACGVWALRGTNAHLLKLALCALVVFVVQIVFLVILRPITPMWMVSPCLPPLAFAIASGWYGWFTAPHRSVHAMALTALGVCTGLALVPYFALLRRDLDTMRSVSNANPLLNAAEEGDHFVDVHVPFYPVRSIDRLSPVLCGPAVLHGRLAERVEIMFDAPVRNACGAWPEFRYGGVAGQGEHLAGLLVRQARASGIEPSLVIGHMAIYDNVRAIAPMEGGRSTPLPRLKVYPEGDPGPPVDLSFEFDAGGGDVIVLTNRNSFTAAMTVKEVQVAGKSESPLYDDGGSILYRCSACVGDEPVHWQIDLNGVAANLDLVVLPNNDNAPTVQNAAPDRR
ncbi:MAG: hypothetical protein LBQ20_07000 [Rhodanobacter sp.]|jgi:hypothetical protein|nr:hypothetical protein [Rhodanobacter sp.]